MQKAVVYGIIAAAVVVSAISIAFALMAFTGISGTTVVSSSPESDEVRTFKHQMGKTEITEIPKRVVVLEWTYAEHVMALGVEPVGVADIEEMNKWVNLKEHKLSSNVTDVGLRWEPNLEVISRIEPDLIIGDSDNNGPIYEDLSAIAPTLLFNAYPLEEENVGGFERMKEEFMTIADVLDRHDQGVTVLERMNQKIAEGRAAVEANGMAGEPFALLMAGTFEESSWMRIYTQNGQASEIIEMMGMENAWPVEHGQWGYSDGGLEDLTTIQDATFFYIAQDDDNLFETTFKENPVWTNLNSVQEGRVYPIGGDTWTYGGPTSAELIVEKVTEAISNSSTRTIKHTMGETEIKGTPERIVVLELNSVEQLYELGVQPVGLGSLDFWASATPEIMAAWSGTKNVGANFEPNLEAIAKLRPDLIIGMQSAHSEMYDDLTSIAPTILLNNYPPEDGPTMLEATKEGAMIVADALNIRDDGIALLERLDTKIKENTAKIKAAGLEGKKFILAETSVSDGQPGITVMLPNSQTSEILEMTGLKNAVPEPDEFQSFGSIDTHLEGLSALDGPDVYFIYKTIPGTQDPLSEAAFWRDNPIWKELSFVQDGRVYNLESNNYMSFYGGVIDLEKASDRITRALAE
jgi:ABC-type Fe3+-hydroxamate transport system substrate-binding protein